MATDVVKKCYTTSFEILCNVVWKYSLCTMVTEQELCTLSVLDVPQ
jgi:hypothetical protein